MKTRGTSTMSSLAALATTCPVMLATNEVTLMQRDLQLTRNPIMQNYKKYCGNGGNNCNKNRSS